LKRLGSKRAQVIGWRDMWAMVLVKKDKVFGEAMSKSPGDNFRSEKAHLTFDRMIATYSLIFYTFFKKCPFNKYVDPSLAFFISYLITSRVSTLNLLLTKLFVHLLTSFKNNFQIFHLGEIPSRFEPRFPWSHPATQTVPCGRTMTSRDGEESFAITLKVTDRSAPVRIRLRYQDWLQRINRC
jgi:hypothetical protein